MLSTTRVLVADGEPDFRSLNQMLESTGYAVSSSSCIEEIARRVGAGEADVVLLTDNALASLDKLLVARCARTATSFIVLSKTMSGDQVRATVRAGVSDVIDPANGEHVLLAAIERVAREAQLRCELALLRARVGDAAQQALVGRSSAIAHVRELVGRVASSCSPVLVTGEAGVGKSLVARLVHDLSDRATRPLVTVRCANRDDSALEGELFGRLEDDDAPAIAGALEEARGGTVVLEDAGALPVALRARLARAMTSRSMQRVGERDGIAVQPRLVLVARESGSESDAASIEDLLSRLNAVPIDVPPLRERRSDIPRLVQHFRQRLSVACGGELAPLSPEEMLPLLSREWRGNVRELERWVEDHVLTARVEAPRAAEDTLRGIELGSGQVTLEQLERAYILHVLALESGHQSRTAARLGIDRRTLYRKLKQYRG